MTYFNAPIQLLEQRRGAGRVPRLEIGQRLHAAGGIGRRRAQQFGKFVAAPGLKRQNAPRVNVAISRNAFSQTGS